MLTIVRSVDRASQSVSQGKGHPSPWLCIGALLSCSVCRIRRLLRSDANFLRAAGFDRVATLSLNHWCFVMLALPRGGLGIHAGKSQEYLMHGGRDNEARAERSITVMYVTSMHMQATLFEYSQPCGQVGLVAQPILARAVAIRVGRS